MKSVKPDKGVFLRKGSAVYQHRIYVPSDVRQFYGGKEELPAKSLGTKDLAQANRIARQSVAEHECAYAERRRNGSSSAPVPSEELNLTPKLIEQPAANHRAEILDSDFATRGRTFTRRRR